MSRVVTVTSTWLLVVSMVVAPAAGATPDSVRSSGTVTAPSDVVTDIWADQATESAPSASVAGAPAGTATDETVPAADRTNDSTTRRDGTAAAAAGGGAAGRAGAARANQSPYTATVVPHQPDIEWGGRAVAVDVHPRDDDTAIVASESGGLFETTDGGATWTHLDGRYPHRLEDVEYADSDPSVIVLAADADTRNLSIEGRQVSGGGIWRSADGGQTWTKPASAEPPATSTCADAGHVTAWSVAFEPETTNVYVGTDCGLAVSTDLGRTWSHERVAGQTRKVGTVISPARDTVDVCTRSDGHFRYRPSSDTWEATAERLPDGSCHRGSPHSLAASPSDPDVLFAVVPTSQSRFTDDSVSTCNTKRELFESDDGGRTWTDLNAPGCASNREPFVATPPVAAPDGTFPVFVGKGVATHRQICTAGAGSLRCSDAPGDWDKQLAGNNIDAEHADHTDIAFPSDSVCPRFLTNDGGVERTSDCGKSWHNVGNSSANGFNALQLYTVNGRIVDRPNHTDLYVGTQDNWNWVGSDGGQAWSRAGPGNEMGFMGLNRTAVSHSSGEPVVILAENRHYTTSGHTLSHTGGWPNPPGVSPGATEVGKVYHLERDTYMQWDTKGTLWLTTNTGAANSWTSTVDLNGAPIWDTPIVGPPDDPTVYVSQKNRVLRVTNLRGGGTANVAVTETGISAGNHVRGEGTFDWNSVYEAVADDGRGDRATIVLADETDHTMKISRDGGRTWQTDAELKRVVTADGRFHMDPLGPPEDTTTQATTIDADPENGSRIFVGTEANGVVASFDGGRTWGLVPDTRRIPAVSDFFFDARTGGDGFRDVYVATYGRGLWKIDDVDKLKPLPAPDRFDRSGRSNDDPESAASVRPGWTHTAHLECPDVAPLDPSLGRKSPGDDCRAVLTGNSRDTPLQAKETWDVRLSPMSLDGAGDGDFYDLPPLPTLATHRGIRNLTRPECGRQSVTIGGQSTVVETAARLRITVTPKGNSLSRTPVRSADGATPINVYDRTGSRVTAGTLSSGIGPRDKLVYRINCPRGRGLTDLVASFGEGTAANSGGYEIEFRYRIDVERPADIQTRRERADRRLGIPENLDRYAQPWVPGLEACRPAGPMPGPELGPDPCAVDVRHPVPDPRGDACEGPTCLQRWELRRSEEGPFEMTVIGNENLDIRLQRADAGSDGEPGPDGELVAESRPVGCVPGEEFGRLLVERGRGSTVREVGTETLVGRMGRACGDVVEGSRMATAAPNSSPEGLAPVRHHLGVESLEPGLYQLVITGPESTYWVEQFTPSTRVLEEDDAASQPRAAFDVEPVDPVTEAAVTVEATAATDGDGTIETYEWRFGAEGEGRTVTTRVATATHTFNEPGEYPVALTVTDDDGNADTVTRAVSVAPAPAGETGVRLDTARRTTGDCPHVDDNRLPSERSRDEAERSPAADDSADSSDEEFEEFEEEGLYCTVYDPEPPRLEAGERIRYDVVVADANTGIDAAAFTVEVSDGSVADVTGVTLGPDATTGREADVRLPADAVTVTADDLRERLGDARGRTVVATITVEAERGGTTDLVLSDTDFRNPRDDAYTVTSETGAGLAVADRRPPPLVDGGRAPTDPDGDGRYEDLNGNGAVTLADVTLLFANSDDDAVTNAPEAFDFNDNGQFSLADVTRLFETVSSRSERLRNPAD